MALRTSYPKFPHRANVKQSEIDAEVVTAEELRRYLKEDTGTLGDSEALALIKFARDYLETNFALIFLTQTWQVSYDSWPGSATPWWDGVREGHISMLNGGRSYPIVIPCYPLQSIVSMTVYDQNDVPAVVDVSEVFNVDTASRPGRLFLKNSQTWPTVGRALDAIKITYTAGFGNSAAAVPPSLRDAVLILAAYYKEHRGECSMTEMLQKSGAAELMRLYSAGRL